MCDGEGAAIKHFISDGVKSNKAFIDCALDMYIFLQSKCDSPNLNVHESGHRSRIVILVEQVKRKELPELIFAKGTRTFHCVKAISRGVLDCRDRSCFCEHCETGQYVICSNKDFVGQFCRRKILKFTNKDSLLDTQQADQALELVNCSQGCSVS